MKNNIIEIKELYKKYPENRNPSVNYLTLDVPKVIGRAHV